MIRCKTRRFYHLGEKRLVEWTIEPKEESDIIVVTKAKYEIYKDNELRTSGEMSIEGNEVSFLFSPTEVGEFMIKAYVTVPPETLVRELVVTVKD